MIPMFDIFSGRFLQKDAIWIDSVEGLAEAYQAMLRGAAEKPVPHFVLSSHSCVAGASLDSTFFLREQESERAEAAAGSLKHDVAITHVETLRIRCEPCLHCEDFGPSPSAARGTSTEEFRKESCVTYQRIVKHRP
jgi:hypothetical protein